MRPILILLLLANVTRAQDSVLLVERLEPGSAWRVATRGTLGGKLDIPVSEKAAAKTISIRGTVVTAYDEEYLAADPKVADRRSYRVYDKLDLRKTVGDVDQEVKLRNAARRMVVLERNGKRVPFSPFGPLTWGELEFLKTEIYVPGLVQLLPGKEVKALESWKLTEAAARELTDLEKVDEQDLIGRYIQSGTINGRKVAELSIGGSCKGVNEDGPTKHILRGTAYFDLETKTITYLSILGEQHLLDAKGKTTGIVEGRFVLTKEVLPAGSLTRTAGLATSQLEPTERNTALLFENSELGVSFEFPRRWHVGMTRGRQIALDDKEGSGVLLTVEPVAKLPTPEKYQREVTDYLRSQKVSIRNADQPRRIDTGIWRFTLDAQEGDVRPLLDYYTVGGRNTGVTVAGRIVSKDAELLRREVERMVRSIRFKD